MPASRFARAALTCALLASVATVTADVVLTPAANAATTYADIHAFDPATGRSAVVRWTACVRSGATTSTHAITYAVNTGGDSSRVALVQQALAQVTRASGLQFRYVGKVGYVPHYAVLHYPAGNRLMFNAAEQRAKTHAELVVGWVSASRTNLFSGNESGVGTISWTGSTQSQLRIVEAAALIKLGAPLKPGFNAGASVGALLLHEIGHAVGLEHVTARNEVMYPVLGSYTSSSYQAGDRAGLRLVGRAAGCFTAPALSPPDPAATARAAGISVTL